MRPVQILPVAFLHRPGAVNERIDLASAADVPVWLRASVSASGVVGVTYLVPGHIVLPSDPDLGPGPGGPHKHEASVLVTDHLSLSNRLQSVQALVDGQPTGWFNIHPGTQATGVPILFGN